MKTIKIRQHKAMTPYLIRITLQTRFRALPRVSFLFFKISLRLTEVKTIMSYPFCYLAVGFSLKEFTAFFLHKKRAINWPSLIQESFQLVKLFKNFNPSLIQYILGLYTIYRIKNQ